MTEPNHEQNDPLALAALEEELRRLPRPEPPARLEAALISAIPPGVRRRVPAGRFRRAPLAVSAAAAAAAFLLVCTSLVVIARSRNDEAHSRNAVVLAPRPPAEPSGLPRASWGACSRARLQSPEAFDEMLARDAEFLLRPESSEVPASLNMRWFLNRMNPIEEEHHEKHSLCRSAPGALV
jgi:hypothetical protein